MLDENLPSFHIKPSPENELNSTVFLSAQGSDLQPEYMIRRPDPRTAAAKNCYAIALYDPFNPDVLYAEVLVQPEWAQPTLSAAEIRALNGAPAPPTPVIPNSFAIQLYNPDQQIMVKRAEKTWGASSSWEFLLPQSTFRVPSESTLDRSQDDPAISDITPKVVFRWKRDNKFTKDISCYMSGKSTDTKKTKEPDITVAMFKGGKLVTIYEPNLHRVDVEDKKGLEVVVLLGAQVIKDLYISPSRDIFNLSSQTIGRKNSMHLIGRNSGGLAGSPTSAPRKNSNPAVPASQNLPTSNRPHASSNTNSRPPPADPRTQWQIDAEAEALRAALQAEEERERKARERQVKEDERNIKKMLEAEEKAQRRKEMEDAKETERLRKLYGVNGTIPSLPPRPQSQIFYPPPPNQSHSFSGSSGGSHLSPYDSAPHSRPTPFQRPVSSPSFAPPPKQPIPQASQGPFACPKINSFLQSSSIIGGTSSSTSSSRPHRGTSASGPYLNPPSGSSANLASVSSFFHGGQRDASEGRRNISKKRSVFF